jgi:hypothetical protein
MELPMPARTAFNLGKIAEQINESVEMLQSTSRKRREEIFEDIDESKEELTEEERNAIVEAETQLQEEMDDLLDTETAEITGEKINISALGTAQVKPTTLFALDWLIVG